MPSDGVKIVGASLAGIVSLLFFGYSILVLNQVLLGFLPLLVFAVGYVVWRFYVVLVRIAEALETQAE